MHAAAADASLTEAGQPQGGCQDAAERVLGPGWWPPPEALHASAAFSDHADELALFGQFVGSWDIEWHGDGLGGQPRTPKGDLHFGWVLGGARSRQQTLDVDVRVGELAREPTRLAD